MSFRFNLSILASLQVSFLSGLDSHNEREVKPGSQNSHLPSKVMNLREESTTATLPNQHNP